MLLKPRAGRVRLRDVGQLGNSVNFRAFTLNFSQRVSGRLLLRLGGRERRRAAVARDGPRRAAGAADLRVLFAEIPQCF